MKVRKQDRTLAVTGSNVCHWLFHGFSSRATEMVRVHEDLLQEV